MKYNPNDFSARETTQPTAFTEGVLLAANLACKPIDKNVWLSLLVNNIDGLTDSVLVNQFQQQYYSLMSHCYHLSQVIACSDVELLTDWASGFLTGWECIEPTWHELNVDDGTQRLLQALLTLCLLIIDEESTRQQMIASGMDNIPNITHLLDNIDAILFELAQFADVNLIGYGTQRINPYKLVGRNDCCPCGSGKKFKMCCG